MTNQFFTPDWLTFDNVDKIVNKNGPNDDEDNLDNVDNNDLSFNDFMIESSKKFLSIGGLRPAYLFPEYIEWYNNNCPKRNMFPTSDVFFDNSNIDYNLYYRKYETYYDNSDYYFDYGQDSDSDYNCENVEKFVNTMSITESDEDEEYYNSSSDDDDYEEYEDEEYFHYE